MLSVLVGCGLRRAERVGIDGNHNHLDRISRSSDTDIVSLCQPEGNLSYPLES
jgi:hypothetical protein